MKDQTQNKRFPTDSAITAWATLIRANTQLLEKVNNTLKKQKLPPLAWYDVLLELSRAEQRGLRQYEIGKQILLPKHSLSRLLDRLEKAHLVQRLTCEEDGRGVVVKITEDGQKLLSSMWPIYAEQIVDSIQSRLSENEISSLSKLLHKLL